MFKKDVKVINYTSIYKVVEVDATGRENPTGIFRVRKKIKEFGRWTSIVRTFDRFEDAKRFAKANYVKTMRSSVKGRSNFFRDVFSRYLAHKEREMKLSSATLDGYKNRAMHFLLLNDISIDEVKPKTVDAWIDLLLDPDYLKKQHSTRINYSHEFSLLSGVIRYYRNYENEDFVSPLLDRHRLRTCARGRTDISEIRFLTANEQSKFLEHIMGKQVFHDLALFQLNTGARIGEAAALEYKSVDFDQNEVRIERHLHWERKKGARIEVIPGTKSGPNRIVPLSAQCRNMLWRRKECAASANVFPGTGENEWLQYRSIQNAYDQIFKKMDLIHRGTHTMRHSFAVSFLNEVKDIYSLQKILGHSDLEETQRYAKYSQESVRRSFQLFKGGVDADVIALGSKLGSK